MENTVLPVLENNRYIHTFLVIQVFTRLVLKTGLKMLGLMLNKEKHIPK